MREIAGVSEVVVEATGGADREPRLSAWVQPLATTALAAPDVRAELIRQLPPEAIPTHIVAVDRFPLLPGGKIEKWDCKPEEATFERFIPPKK